MLPGLALYGWRQEVSDRTAPHAARRQWSPIFTVGSVLLAVLAVLMACYCVPGLRARYRERLCRENLSHLHQWVLWRCMDQNGSLPSDIGAALAPWESGGFGWCLVCPATGHKPGDLLKCAEWADYTYIDWIGRHVEKPPGYYPLMYDRRMANHGQGGNVLLVSGAVIWDPGAGFLKSFAQANPAYEIDLPQ